MGILAYFVALNNVVWDIYQLEEEKRKLPQYLAKQQQILEKAKTQLTQFQEDNKHRQVQIREQETNLATIESNIAKKQIQLNESKNNREYTALQEEIKEKQGQKGNAEEAVIKLMEENEKYKVKIQEQQQKVVDLQREYDKAKKETEQNLGEIEQAVAVLEKKRMEKRAAAEKLDAKTLEAYECVARSHTGKAMVPVEEEACGYCQIQLLENELSLLRGGRIVFCKSCARLLYMEGYC
jgi:predicted  nucleic acid-binding Zn-ribbon protein